MNEDLQISRLGSKDLDNILALQNKIISNLSSEQKHFTINRSKEDFAKVLASQNMHMYGIYVGKTLVAQSILNFPQNNEARDMPEFGKEYQNSDIAIYQAILVDPDYRGQGLMMRMLQVREDMAVMNGKKIAICKIAADNHFSWKNALKHGMQITKANIDKSGFEKLYLQKRLDCISTQQNLKNKIIINLNHNYLKQIMLNMSKCGKMGIWDKNINSLVYIPSPQAYTTHLQQGIQRG